MNNSMTEEGPEGSGGCLICFNKLEKYEILPNQESQKIISSSWKYLHENIANTKLQTAKSIDENQQPCCKKCFDVASKLIQLSEHLKKCQKQILDLSIEFSFGVLARRTQAESINNKSDDSPKVFIVLNVSGISPSLFSMDQLTNPTTTEDFQHPCANNFVEMDAVLNVPQDPLGIVKQEFNEYYDNNSQTEMLESPEETTNLIENHLVKAEDIQDGVAISDTTRSYPANGTDMEFINNITSQIDDSMSAGSDSSNTKDATELPACAKPVAILTKVNELGVSEEFDCTSSPQDPSIKLPLRNKSSKKIHGQPTTVSNHILGKIVGGNLKKVSISGSSPEVHETVGNPQRNYKCCFCEKVLASSSDLERHIRTHTREKPFKCSVCEKTFSEMCNLKRHQIIHTGEKLFKCSVCEKTFSEMSNLKRHQIIHTGEKSFKCSFCAKAFSSSSHAKRHETVHTGKPFKCSFCVKAYTQAYDLKKHEKIHTRKTFKCSYCGKAFTDITIAKNHERIHSNEISHLNVRIAK